MTDETEARLIALACSEAPEGRARWTPRPLADKAVELGVVEGRPSHEGARRALKNELRPHRVARWAIPPKASAAFVACMEDALSL